MVKNTLLVHPKEIYVQNAFKCSFFPYPHISYANINGSLEVIVFMLLNSLQVMVLIPSMT